MKILIISSNYTGKGHKSIFETLKEKIDNYNINNINFVEGFYLNGKFCKKLAKSYGFLSRKAKPLWKCIWLISEYTQFTTFLTKATMKNRLLRTVKEYNPDIILSLHPNYNKSVIDILEKNNINIPHATVISDIVTISQLWIDKRAALIFCGTKECENACIKKGVDISHLRLTGFPVRKQFYDYNTKSEINSKSTLNILIISGSEGVGNLEFVAEQILKKVDSIVTMITGKNIKLKQKIDDDLAVKYPKRIIALGYLTDNHNVMKTADILVTKGSPNTMFEAIAMNIPLVAFGKPLPQEKGNIEFIQNNEIGVICKNENQVPEKIKELIDNNFAKYNNIKRNQHNFIYPFAADNIIKELKKII